MMIMPLILLALIVVHELIHGIVWGLCLDQKFKGIEFGFIWRLLTPYCTCTKPLKQKAYVIGSAMPTLLLGHLPAVYAVFTGNLFLFLIGMIMITGGAGDKLIQDRIRRSEERNALCLDHPYECGVVLFVKQ